RAGVERGAAWGGDGEPRGTALSGRGGAGVTVGLRPEDLEPAEAGERGLAAQVELVEPLGSETLVHWVSPAGAHVSRVTSLAVPTPGTSASLAARPEGLLLFDSTSGASLLESQRAAAQV